MLDTCFTLIHSSKMEEVNVYNYQLSLCSKVHFTVFQVVTVVLRLATLWFWFFLATQCHFQHREFSCRAQPQFSLTRPHKQPGMPEHAAVFIFTKPANSHTYFKRGHSVSLSRLQVMPLITSDTASCVFMCMDLQYVPGGLSRESEVQRPPCQNDKSILIHAHTHARLHTNTHFQQRDVSTVVRGHFHCLCGALFPPHHPLSSSSTAACLAFSPAILLSVSFSVDADRAVPHSTFSSKLSQTLVLTLRCYRLLLTLLLGQRYV